MKIKPYLIDPLFLIAISGAVFYGSLDIYFVSENISHIEKAYNDFFSLVFTNFYFRPLYAISLYFDRILWGANYSGYHFSNLLLHVSNTLLVYYLALQILQTRLIAITSAFLFLLHPIHSLSLFWISGRTDMLCSLFYLSAFILFVYYSNSNNRKYYYFSLCAFFLAMLAKEMAISLPLLVVAYFIIFDKSKLKERLWKSFRLSMGYILIVLSMILIRITFISDSVFSSKDHSGISLTQLIKNAAVYLGLLIIPGGHIEIAGFLKANPAVFFILSAFALGGFVLSLLWIRKSKPLLFFTMFVLITLLPVLRLMMRWYLYIPSAGFCLALGYMLYRLYQSGALWRKLAYVLAAAIFFSYAFFVSREQNRWIEAGEVSREISSQIAQVVAERRPEKCFFLNAPAELQEVPVFMYGLQSLINFRLREEFGYPDSVKIVPVSYISFSKQEDMDKQIIGKNDAGEFIISLELSDSHFIFPLHSEIYSKRTKLAEGLEVADIEFKSRIEKINARGEAIKLRAQIPETQTKEPKAPVLYYLNGNIYSDLSFQD